MDYINDYGLYFAVFIAGILGSAIAISYFFYFFKYKTGKQRKTQKSAGSRQVIDAGEYGLALQLRELKQELADVKAQLEEKKRETERLNSELKTVMESGRSVDFDIENTRLSRYFSVPSNNGTFPEEKGNLKENDNTWYKIEYDKDKTVGSLYYLPGKSDKRALNQMDLFLKPVCEFENSGKPNPQKIHLLFPGKVVLKDGNWIVEKKIKLRLS